MLQIEVPTHKILQLEHLVLDYNGTLACDGVLCVGVRSRLDDLGRQLRIHVVTADTFGKARAGPAGIDDTRPCRTVQQFYRGKFMKSKIRLD